MSAERIAAGIDTARTLQEKNLLGAVPTALLHALNDALVELERHWVDRHDVSCTMLRGRPCGCTSFGGPRACRLPRPAVLRFKRAAL